MENASPKKNMTTPLQRRSNAQKMLSEGLRGAGNRLQKAYINTGAIHMGDYEMIWFTPEGLDQILKRIEDSDEARLYARELFLKFFKPLNSFTPKMKEMR